MVATVKKAVKETAAPKKAAESPAKVSSHVKVKNISDQVINTSKGSIGPGEEGEASHAEVKQLDKFIKEI